MGTGIAGGVAGSPGERVEPGHPPQSPERGGRVAESFGGGEGKGAEEEGGWGGRPEGLCPPRSIRPRAPKSHGRAPRSITSPPPPPEKTSTSSFPGSIPVAGSGTRSRPLPAGAPSLPRAHKANRWCLMKKHLLN